MSGRIFILSKALCCILWAGVEKYHILIHYMIVGASISRLQFM